MILFHLSPSRNREGLINHGLCTELAKKRSKGRIFLCGLLQIRYWIHRVAAHHKIEPEELDVWQVYVKDDGLVYGNMGQVITEKSIPSGQLTYFKNAADLLSAWRKSKNPHKAG